MTSIPPSTPGYLLSPKVVRVQPQRDEASEKGGVDFTVVVSDLVRKKALIATTNNQTLLPTTNFVTARKFMQTLDDRVYRELETAANRRGVTIQGLIRAVIIPEWVNQRGKEATLTQLVPDITSTTEQGPQPASLPSQGVVSYLRSRQSSQ